METIGESVLWSFYNDAPKVNVATNTEIRRGDGHEVASYLDLATKIAELQFKNRDYVLVFRGQRNDHLNRNNNTSLKPTLFRPVVPNRNPGPTRLTRRFEILRNAEEQLIRQYEWAQLDDLERLKRHRILRWAILQHYEVCKTPLLDVTHSLRIAASFASVNAKEEAFIFVLGVPNLSGAITASAEGGASNCPAFERLPAFGHSPAYSGRLLVG